MSQWQLGTLMYKKDNYVTVLSQIKIAITERERWTTEGSGTQLKVSIPCTVRSKIHWDEEIRVKSCKSYDFCLLLQGMCYLTISASHVLSGYCCKSGAIWLLLQGMCYLTIAACKSCAIWLLLHVMCYLTCCKSCAVWIMLEVLYYLTTAANHVLSD